MATEGSTGDPVQGASRALVSMPGRMQVSPFSALFWRFMMAIGLVFLTALIVWLDRASYSDNVSGDTITFVDAIYYATITITTTGYGDITPLSPHARLLNAVLITPLRIVFLVLLVGTTIEVLANQGNRVFRDQRWRKRMRNHVVVIGYGTKGRSAVNTMRRKGIPTERIVVIDSDQMRVEEANLDGVPAFHGDGTRRPLLRRAEISKAKDVVICLDRDDAAILTTLTVRQLNPSANIVVSMRQQENVPLVRQSGATSVITSSDTVGRLMGLSAMGPDLGSILQDLITSGTGLEVTQRQALPEEVGRNPNSLVGERVIGLVRNDTLRRFYDPTASKIEAGDQLIVVRKGMGTIDRQRDHES